MFKRTVLSSVLVLAFTCAASASTIIYNNLSSSNQGVDYVYPTWGPLADSFSTPASGFSLGDVQVLLQGTPSPGSTTVSLFSDSSTSPGTLLTTIGTLSDNSLTAALSVFDFPLGTPYALAGNTRYWIVLSGDTVNSTTAEWSWSLDQSALGVAGEDFANYGYSGGWQVYGNIGGPYQMELGSFTAAPEPGTLLLLGMALFGLVGSRFRRRLASQH
jgi:PEP-CTERM motif